MEINNKSNAIIPPRNSIVRTIGTGILGYSTGEINENGNIECTVYENCCGYYFEARSKDLEVIRMATNEN